MSYTTAGSFIDSINDRGAERSKHINHIMRQGLVQFVALDYAILKAVRILREDFQSIDKPYLLANSSGTSEFSIGLPMLSSVELKSLFRIPTPPQPAPSLSDQAAEIEKFRSLAKILYRINAQRFDWIDPQDETWVTNPLIVPSITPVKIEIATQLSLTNTRMAVSIFINNTPAGLNPRIKIALESPSTGVNPPNPFTEIYNIQIPLQEKVTNGHIHGFSVEVYDDTKISKAYSKFRTAQLLQGIWSYSLLYPTIFFELSPRYKDIIDAANNFPEQTDPSLLTGIEEGRKSTRFLEFIKKLESANLGIPLQDEVKEIMKNIVQRIGNIPIFNNNRYDDIPVTDPAYDDYEDNNEIAIVDELLLKIQIPANPPYPTGTDADTVLREVGLENIFHQLFDLVQDDSSGGFNLEIFNGIREIWGRLFSISSGTPDGINYIEKQLPPVESAFTTIVPAESQRDLFADELDKVRDFLRGAIRQDRLMELRNLLNDPSPSMFLTTFRSLNGLDKDVFKTSDFWALYNGNRGLYDRENRFDYLFLIWWVLTYEQKFSEIPDFASRRNPPVPVNYDAMFPGGLGGPSILFAGGPNQIIDQSNSSARLELEYATYERNLSSLDNQLAKPGGLIRLARSYGGLPI